VKIGVGYFNHMDAFLTGKKVADNAMKMGKIDRADLVIAFCHGSLDHEGFFSGLRAVVGSSVPIIGGSAIGIITNDDLSYEGYPAGAAIIESETLQVRVATAGDLNRDEGSAGKRLGEKFTDDIGEKLLLIFYDSIKNGPTATTPPVINASPPLIEGIEETFNRDVPILGGGVLGNYEFTHTKQFCGSHVDTQQVVGALLGGEFKPYFKIMHGCIPKDGVYHTVTKVDGPVLYEVDGKPIVKLIDEQYGNTDWRSQMPVGRLTIGMNYGDKFGEFKEDNFVNRLITGILPDEKGVVIFEPDLKEGTEILFMLRNSKMMIDSAKNNSEGLLKKIIAKGERPLLGFYIDCGGRTIRLSDTLTEEASEVQDAFNQYDIPLFGFYSGVEVAPFLGKSRGLDWTGVLLVFAKG
jgi:hypothetical protein